MKTSLKFVTWAMLIAVMSTGCTTVKGWLGKRADGSLNYQSAKKLDPIEIPINQPTAAFVPLYPTPAIGENTLNLQNSSGKQYQLPAPPKVVQ